MGGKHTHDCPRAKRSEAYNGNLKEQMLKCDAAAEKAKAKRAAEKAAKPKPARAATPKAAPKAKPATKAAAPKVAAVPRAERSKRGEQAHARKAEQDGRRGPGKRIEEGDLLEYIRTVMVEHPESSMSDERMYARWIKRLTFDWATFRELWEQAESMPRKRAPAKAPAAKRAPVTKASSRKVPAAKRAPAKRK